MLDSALREPARPLTGDPTDGPAATAPRVRGVGTAVPAAPSRQREFPDTFRITDPGTRSVFLDGAIDRYGLPASTGSRRWPGGPAPTRANRHRRSASRLARGNDISVEAAELGLVDQIGGSLAEAVHTAAVLMGRISDRELAVRRRLVLEAAPVEYGDARGAPLAACDREPRRLRAPAGTARAPAAGQGPPAGQVPA